MRKKKNLLYFLRYARKDDVKVVDSINLGASSQKDFVRSVKELENSSSVIIVVTRNWSRTEKRKNPRELINQASKKNQDDNRSLVPKFITKIFDFIIRTKPPTDYVIGFISLKQVIEEVHVMMLAIRSDERRNGLGELLLIGAIQEAIKRKARIITLEVQSSNLSAQALYKKYGFIEPIKYYVPSIGISEIEKIPKKFNKEFDNDFFIASMGNNQEEGDLSIHHIKLDKEHKKILKEDIIVIGERIRDLKYIESLNKIILFIENSPGIGVLSY